MWQIITKNITNEEGVSYNAYGFRCDELELHDFTSVKEEAERLLLTLNKLDVSPIHIYDVIEDHFAAM